MPEEEVTDSVVPTRELDAQEKPCVNGADTNGNASDRESSEESNASSSRSPDDLRVDTDQPQHGLANGTDTATKRKRSLDDEEGEPDAKSEPRDVADRALTMLNGDARMANAQPTTNGTSHHGSQTREWGAVQQTPMYRYADQNGLPTPDTPSSAGTDRPWAASNGPATNGYHHVNGGTPTATRPRKRVFSHRTRSGCQTCRSRKKKCDERKPTCGNCERAGQVCLGYANPTSVTRDNTAATRQPVQIQPVQARDGPPEQVNGYHHPIPDQAPSRHGNEEADSAYATLSASDSTRSTRPPGYPGQPCGHGPGWPPQHARSDTPTTTTSSHIMHTAPAAHLDVRSEHSTSSPSREMRPPAQSTSTGPSQSSSMTQQMHLPPPSSYTNPTNLTQPYYAGPPTSEPHSRARHHEYSAPPPQHAHVSYDPQPPPPRPTSSYSYRPPSHNHSHSTASSRAPSVGSRIFSEEEIARSKMLRHTRYDPNDSTLVWDRANCKRACEKYNAQLSQGLLTTPEQMNKFLAAIVDPSIDPYWLPSKPLARERGFIGDNVRVESGFQCTYGYNLKLLHNVQIEENVRIDDAAKVEIGANVWICAGTQIITSRPCLDSMDRKGTKSEKEAQDIVIESDVVIGESCVIMPGVRLGKGCTIEPNMTVKRDVESMKTWGRDEEDEWRKRRGEGVFERPRDGTREWR